MEEKRTYDANALCNRLVAWRSEAADNGETVVYDTLDEVIRIIGELSTKEGKQ